MKSLSICLLIVAASGASALDVRPDPGLPLSPVWFTDIRLCTGLAAPATEASAPGSTIEADIKPAPHVALQAVCGRAGDSVGWALGLEYAYDDDLGAIGATTGSNTRYGVGGGQIAMRSHGLNLLPKIVLRPGFGDPYDWGPGSVQVELGPMAGYGLGHAHLGSSGHSDWTGVFRYGARLAVVLTSETGWQGGLELGWEGFTADPSWKGDNGSISGDGIVGSLIIGRRL